MTYTVYILQSEKDGKKYIGQTNNLTRRMVDHNSGKVVATKNRRPFTLIYCETFQTRKEALSREKFFKTHKGYNYLKKLGFY